jgi:hypothetical protein
MRRLMFVAALALAGCGGPAIEPKQAVTLDSVPEPVMKVARQKLPGVKFDRAWRKANGEYEVAGKSKTGKVYEIDIAPDGTVTEIEGALDEQGRPK